MAAEVGIVTRDFIPAVWPGILPLYNEATNLQEKFKPEELYNILMTSGCYQLWTAVDGGMEGVGITALVQGNYTSKLHIIDLYCKPLGKYLALGIDKLEKFACFAGADEIVFDGRDGWERVMSRFGYRPTLQMRKSVRQLW